MKHSISTASAWRNTAVKVQACDHIVKQCGWQGQVGVLTRQGDLEKLSWRIDDGCEQLLMQLLCSYQATVGEGERPHKCEY